MASHCFSTESVRYVQKIGIICKNHCLFYIFLVSEVQKHWSKCCEIYYKHRNDSKKAKKLRSSDGDDEIKNLIEQMQFIEPYLQNR